VDTLIEAIVAQKARRARAIGTQEFIPAWPNPGTWLNGQRWTDELGPAGSGSIDQDPVQDTIDRYNAALERQKAKSPPF